MEININIVAFFKCARLNTQCPIVALAFATSFAWYLHETLVQTEIVTYGILPAFLVLLEIGKARRDVRVYLAKCRPFQMRVLSPKRIQAISLCTKCKR